MIKNRRKKRWKLKNDEKICKKRIKKVLSKWFKKFIFFFVFICHVFLDLNSNKNSPIDLLRDLPVDIRKYCDSMCDSYSVLNKF